MELSDEEFLPNPGFRMRVLPASRYGIATAEEKSWEQFVAEVEQLQRAGQYTQAETVLLATLKESGRFAPGDSRTALIIYKLGNIYSHLGRPTEAERFFLRSLLAWSSREIAG